MTSRNRQLNQSNKSNITTDLQTRSFLSTQVDRTQMWNRCLLFSSGAFYFAPACFSCLWRHHRRSVCLSAWAAFVKYWSSLRPPCVGLNWLADECWSRSRRDDWSDGIKPERRKEQNRLIKFINVKARRPPSPSINHSVSLLLFIICSHTPLSPAALRALSLVLISLHPSLLSG